MLGGRLVAGGGRVRKGVGNSAGNISSRTAAATGEPSGSTRKRRFPT